METFRKPTAKELKEQEVEICLLRNSVEAVQDEARRNERWTGNPSLAPRKAR